NAHNGHAIQRLVENLKNKFADKKIYLLFSALQTKDVKTMLWQLKNLPNTKIYLTSFDYPKAVDISDFSKEGLETVPSWSEWLEEIPLKMGGDEVLLITGSLYFVSQVRRFIKNGK
ncbi:MAG: bifunctional folylpolyglutamate synthase/dihydrofolate synthase, partial [Lactobacillales bacterium]|nr:bifunctional folylpolyglutamate synthase/dihydrofolate synthase [Lactobacillales bacterium]